MATDTLTMASRKASGSDTVGNMAAVAPATKCVDGQQVFLAKCVEAMEAAIEQTKKCLTATEEANKIIISQSGLDAILAAVKDYYERIRELETDININVDGGTPKSTDLLLVKGGTPFTTDYDKYIAGTSHTI